LKYPGTGFIIQARLGSTRLPEKIILPFYKDKSIIELLIDKFRSFDSGIPFIVATSTSKTDDRLVDLLQRQKVTVFRGSEDNVLERFIEAGRLYKFDNIIRICADNPFLDINGTYKLLDLYFNEITLLSYHNSRLDYTGYKVAGNLPSIKSHLGLWGEIVSLKALEKVKQAIGKRQEATVYKEHVTNYVYENRDEFDVLLIDAPQIVYARKDIRLTVDTKEDFEMSKEIYSKLIEINSNFEIKNLVKFLDNNKNYLEIMKAQIEMNSK
jgi:spore coat polysaccharide biosynthesis protein SpsF (cytidylyltransferase family)